MKKIISVITAISIMTMIFSMTACGKTESSEESKTTSETVVTTLETTAATTEDIAETTADTESVTTDEALTSDDGDDSDDSIPEETGDSEETSQGESQYIVDGVFTDSENKISFTVPDGWDITSTTLALVFTDSNDSNNYFNVTQVEGVTGVMETYTQAYMTKLFSSTMEEFKMEDFNTMKIDGCEAIEMVMTGKMSKRTTSVCEYIIDSGKDLFYFAFITANGTDLSSQISTVMDSLKITK